MSWKTYTIKEKTDLTVSAYVKGRFKLSSRDIQGLFRKKRVKVNSRVAHSKRPLKVGDVLTVQLPQDKDYGMTVEKGPIDVIYEDKHTLVINKPPFMLVHPTGQTKEHTLSNFVAGYYAKKGVVHKIRPAHRLDRDTSGCILFGKTKEAQQYYSEQMQQGHIARVYRGFVQGELTNTDWETINEPIGVDPIHDNRRCVDEFGQAAQTRYRVLDESGKCEVADKAAVGTSSSGTVDSAVDGTADRGSVPVIQANATYIEFTIPTGRTHQIRVHMAHIGHPVVGDAMYGRREKPYTRQCWHAYELQFVPFGQTEVISVKAELPENFGREKKNTWVLP